MPLNAIMQSFLKNPGAYAAVLIERMPSPVEPKTDDLAVIASAESDNVPSERDAPAPSLVHISLMISSAYAGFHEIEDGDIANFTVGNFRIVVLKVAKTPLLLVVSVQSGSIISKSLPRILRRIERRVMTECAQLKLPAVSGGVP